MSNEIQKLHEAAARLAGWEGEPPSPQGVTQDTLRSTDWLEALAWHIADMKSREQDHRRESDDERMKADVIMHERMELENRINKTKRI